MCYGTIVTLKSTTLGLKCVLISGFETTWKYCKIPFEHRTVQKFRSKVDFKKRFYSEALVTLSFPSKTHISKIFFGFLNFRSIVSRSLLRLIQKSCNMAKVVIWKKSLIKHLQVSLLLLEMQRRYHVPPVIAVGSFLTYFKCTKSSTTRFFDKFS